LSHSTDCISIDEKIIINCFNLHIKRVRYTHTHTCIHAHTHTHTLSLKRYKLCVTVETHTFTHTYKVKGQLGLAEGGLNIMLYREQRERESVSGRWGALMSLASLVVARSFRYVTLRYDTFLVVVSLRITYTLRSDYVVRNSHSVKLRCRWLHAISVFAFASLKPSSSLFLFFSLSLSLSLSATLCGRCFVPHQMCVSGLKWAERASTPHSFYDSFSDSFSDSSSGNNFISEAWSEFGSYKSLVKHEALQPQQAQQKKIK